MTKMTFPMPKINVEFLKENGVKIFVVGGAVRDTMLGHDPKDVDYVVTGATPELMESTGLSPVGAAFPVYLTEDGQEVALARTERKSGTGYLGFTVDFSPSTTLEEDLLRRDLTINAIAVDLETGEVIDPFNGTRHTLSEKLLMAVNPATFVEDPVRVLRLARFAARFPEFKVATETVEAVHNVPVDELKNLEPQRIMKELLKMWDQSDEPSRFFKVLKDLNVLQYIIPEIDFLENVIEPLKWHPEGNTFAHLMLVLDALKRMNGTHEEFMAALLHDLGKSLTANTTKHYGHDLNGVPLVREFAEKYTLTNEMKTVAMSATREHMLLHKYSNLNAKTRVKIFDRLRAKHSTDLLKSVVKVTQADEEGRLVHNPSHELQLESLLFDLEAYNSVDVTDLRAKYAHLEGVKFGELLRSKRIAALRNALQKELNKKS